MRFEEELKKTIEEEANKLSSRYHAYHNNLEREYQRNIKRSGDRAKKLVKKPDYWSRDRMFNPFYVKRRARSIARSIAAKIRAGTYEPREPYVKQIPKEGGGERSVCIYQIPDAAVSKIYYARLLKKNRHRFSSFSYAYRNDRNLHFAIQDVWVNLSKNSRVFVAEFDFSDFFGSISRSFLEAQFDRNGFFISDEERMIIRAFLKRSDIGIPQGTSISLFLANLACWELDQKFEAEGLKFARYADDTVIWGNSYEKICSAFRIIEEFSVSTGIRLNPEKTKGISLLTRSNLPSELSSKKTAIEFLGYSVSVDAVSIKPSSVLKIKKQISYILYKNLIQPLKVLPFRSLMIPTRSGRDDALAMAMSQIRRYMYGDLSKQQINAYLLGRSHRINYKGLMSFYPLVNDSSQLAELDGWLVSVIYRALVRRRKLLKANGFDRTNSFPFDVRRDDIPRKFSPEHADTRLLEVPSFKLMQQVLEKGLITKGIDHVMHPSSSEYAYR